MQIIGHFIVRLIAILLGVFVAMVAASIFLSFGMFSNMFSEFFNELNWVVNGDPYRTEDTGGLVTGLVVIVGFFTSFYVLGLAALPAAIAIATAELMRWQSMTINLVLGGFVALATGLSLFGAQHDGLPSDGTLVVLLATGFIGGFFYWLVAGRSAGKWLGESA
ncbi:MAG: hypothetical protein WBD01_07150 [Salaquimonas sp.]